MSVTIDADANTILISQDSNAVSVTQLGGLVTVVDPAAGRLSVLFAANAIAVSTPGTTGAIGPAGPTGPSGSSSGPLDDLTDVLIISPADGDLLKYNSGLLTWTNSNKLDGGNF